jgi:hypothetical protein
LQARAEDRGKKPARHRAPLVRMIRIRCRITSNPQKANETTPTRQNIAGRGSSTAGWSLAGVEVLGEAVRVGRQVVRAVV